MIKLRLSYQLMLDHLICVPEHAFAITFFHKPVALGTVGLHACIGLAVVNPIRKLAAITHLDRPTVESYKSSLTAIFRDVITDNKDKCYVYLIGGAQEPKEGYRGNELVYPSALASETLACSIKEFLANYKNIEIERIDMFHAERPDAFAIQLDPNTPAKLFAIAEDDEARFEYEEGKLPVYHQNMMADAIHYQEFQEYSYNPFFRARPKEW